MRSIPTRCFALLLLAATSAVPSAEPPTVNPAAPGFDHQGSDPRAIEIADEVMQALGGRDAWDRTRHVRWRFFGRRLHVWDRLTGDIRVEGVDRETSQPYVVLMNLHSKSGRAWRDGVEAEGDELATLLDSGEAAWINDSYWMFMPYKLKDSGVTLAYVGDGETADGSPADVLELTFDAVGRTPENKYRVYVGQESRLVEQWDFYSTSTDPEPRFSTPWSNWRRYGSILLSDSRGENGHTEIAVFDRLPASVYGEPDPIDWTTVDTGPE